MRKASETSPTVGYLAAPESLLEPKRLGVWKTVLVVLFFVVPFLMLLLLLAGRAS